MSQESSDDNFLGNASLISLKLLLDDKGKPYLPLMYTFPFGTELGISDESALEQDLSKKY